MRRHALIAAVLLAPVAGLAQPAPQAIPVGVVAAAKQPVTQGIEFVGRVEAIEKVDVQARVSGYLAAVDFTEGGIVRQGDRLYMIDQAPFQAAVQQARGTLLQAQAQLTNAGLQRKRAEELVKTSATSVAVRDQRVAEEQTAQGQAIAADAALQTAAINLSYTVITAPIAGRIGRTVITRGNLVTPQTGTLTTIVSQDPVYVTFPVSQREFLRVKNGTQLDTGGLLVRVHLADGTAYPEPGRINFVNVTVDRSPTPCWSAPPCRTPRAHWWTASSYGCGSRVKSRPTCWSSRRRRCCSTSRAPTCSWSMAARPSSAGSKPARKSAATSPSRTGCRRAIR